MNNAWLNTNEIDNFQVKACQVLSEPADFFSWRYYFVPSIYTYSNYCNKLLHTYLKEDICLAFWSAEITITVQYP